MNLLNRCSTSLLLLSSLQLSAQISLTDHFNDNDLLSPVEWLGDTSAFIINSSLELQLNAASKTSPAFLTCRSTIIDRASWEFYIKLDFSPSSSNFAEVYLASDQLDPDLVSEAYIVRVGGISGSNDDVSLYVKNENRLVELIDGIDGLAGGQTVEMMIKVQKDSNHLWILWVDHSLSGNYQLQGTAYDSSIISSSYFSFWAKYTSTRSNKFFWDSLSVSGFPFRDLEPIKLLEVSVIDSNKLSLSLSEKPEISSAIEQLNYRLLDNGLSPDLISFDGLDSSKLNLYFNSPFVSGRSYTLEVSNLTDRSFNEMHTDSQSFVYYRIDPAYFGDVRITEVMADPIPSQGLPEVEYLELLNTTSSFFNLKHWRIADPGRMGELPDHILGPGEYLVVCEIEDTAFLSTFGAFAGIEDFPSLNNSEDQLWLSDSNGITIDQLQYRSSWHQDDLKRDGGWSLEMINPYLKCSGEDNFSSSIGFLGGSPAKQNSIFDDRPDTIAPQIVEIELISEMAVIAHFNEVLDTSISVQINVSLQNDSITHFASFIENGRSIHINLSQALDSGKWYSLRFIDLIDCEGNAADTLLAKLLLPFIAQPKEIILNEILFNPKSGGIDFIELYNLTGKFFDLDGLHIGNDEDTSSWKQISSKHKLIGPHELIVLSEDLYTLETFHRAVIEERHIEADLPAFPNEKGSFYLWNQESKLIEHFDYHEEMHFQLLSSFEGVSLERLSSEGESSAENFFSAASSSDFATPSRENSQRWPLSSKAIIGFRERIFSPDNDGFQDLLFLDYQFEKTGFVVSVDILDADGRSVRKLINNQLLAAEGSLRWDGINDQGSRVPIGIYILTFEAFHPSGEVVFKKLPLVVAGILD